MHFFSLVILPSVCALIRDSTTRFSHLGSYFACCPLSSTTGKLNPEWTDHTHFYFGIRGSFVNTVLICERGFLGPEKWVEGGNIFIKNRGNSTLLSLLYTGWVFWKLKLKLFSIQRIQNQFLTYRIRMQETSLRLP